ncbi:glutathione S-transferase [Thozetella sp. PMI_491]|nr:glutathione S-transferase [Thozetella sp. PMI_491]
MTQPTVTLYFKNASCSWVAHALLHHLSLPFKGILLKGNDAKLNEAADGSFTHEEYLKINPTGMVPALATESGEIITELPAVVTYIACLAPAEVGQKMLGATPLDRARVIEWTTWFSGTFQGRGTAACMRPGRLVDGEEAQKSVTAKALELLRSCYQRIEERLEGHQYAVGEDLTVVDLYLYLFRRWAMFLPGIGEGFAEKFPDYEKLARKIEELEGVKKALIEEELEMLFGQHEKL